MRRSLIAIALVGWSGVWAACSSFDDAPRSSGVDAAAGDSTTEDGAANVDSSPPSDAGADATFSCVGSEYYLCDGFERTGNVATGWNGVTNAIFTELSLSQKNPNSGEGSMQAKILVTDGGGRQGSLRRALPATATSASVDFWVRYDDAPIADTAIGGIGLDTGEGYVFVQIAAGGGFVFAEQIKADAGVYTTLTEVSAGVARAGEYRHVRIEVGPTLVDAGRGARVTIDGEPTEFGLKNPTGIPVVVYLGPTFSETKPREELLWYDDVVIEAAPR